MKIRLLLLCALAAFTIMGQEPPPFATRKFAAGGKIHLQIHSGDVKVVRGHDREHIVVRLTGPDTVSFSGRGNNVTIRIPEAAHLRAVVELPDPSELTVRMLAGQLTVEGIEANQDLNNSVGDITVSGPQHIYKSIEASVRVGAVEGLAPRNTQGMYSMRAHVNVGDIHFLPGS